MAQPATISTAVKTINTHHGLGYTNSVKRAKEEMWLVNEAKAALGKGSKIIVIPENTTYWYAGTREIWNPIKPLLKKKRAVVFIGRVKAYPDQSYDSGFEVLNGIKPPQFLKERMPIPLGEWQPWLGVKYSGRCEIFCSCPP